MRYEPSSEVRHAAAMRLMQRVESLMKAELVAVPVAFVGDPPPGRDALAERHVFEEVQALLLAEDGPLRTAGSDNMFFRAKLTAGKKKTMINRAVIAHLIRKGKMRWINSSHTACELVHDS
jgi:hypothetical protein